MTCISRQGGAFNGLFKETFDFLKALRANNSKSWFEENKENYKNYLLEPLLCLVVDLSLTMLSIDPRFEATPSVNKTISRIYKDTRFSKDKSPYKTTMWITFKRPGKEWQNAPAYFFQIMPESYRYGMGFYSAERDIMNSIRNAIDKKQKDFLKIFSLFSNQNAFVAEGEKYKKTLSSAVPNEFQDWYQRKNIYLVCNKNIDNVLFSRKLLDELSNDFNLIAPIYHYFWKAKLGADNVR